MIYDNDKIKEDWDIRSDKYFKKQYEEMNAINMLIENPTLAFPTKIYENFMKYIKNFNGKHICIPSSGDNTAVFGFHLLGAQVTSCDISAEQIKNARKIADEQGWNIEFIVDDSMSLSKLKNDEYDFVYTSNGVHVWISDLAAMYRNFNRILKNGGY